MAATFNNVSLLKKKGDALENVQGQDALKGKILKRGDLYWSGKTGAEIMVQIIVSQITAIYFSAMWCPSCRQFTPKLMRFYDKVKKAGCNIEVVLCSRDRSEPDLHEYFKDHNGNWLALPYGNNLMQDLLKKYEVATIPALKIVREDGKLIVDKGRQDIQEKGQDPVALFKEWEKLAAAKK